MTFEELIKSDSPFLTEGSIIELIRRQTTLQLDPNIENAVLLLSDDGREALAKIYSQYVDIAVEHNLPILLFTPTWRANPERIASFGRSSVSEINQLAVEFLKNVRRRYSSFQDNIFIGGLIGCKGNAYKPEEALSTSDAILFHEEQVEALKSAGVDFIQAATLPALTEAVGIATLLAEKEIPDLISFITRPDGNILDGTPLYKAMETIDKVVSPKPTSFMVNCVHPALFHKSLENQHDKLSYVLSRLAGLQANAAAMSPEELDEMDHLESDTPYNFADSMLKLHTHFNLNLLGGCCGTNFDHLSSMARQLKP